MIITVFLLGVFFSLVNVQPIYACHCTVDTEGEQQHIDSGHTHIDAEFVYSGEQSEPFVQCAIETFGSPGVKRMALTAKAEGGCDFSKRSLRAEEINSIKEMLRALGNKDSRRLLALGIMMGSTERMEKPVVSEDVSKSESTDNKDYYVSNNTEYENILSNAEEILEARLEMIMALEVQ